MRDDALWGKIVREVFERFDRLDILVNNAGVISTGNLETTDAPAFRHAYEVNVEGAFLGCKHAVPLMAQTGGGSIINISSVAAVRPVPDVLAYAVSKGALRTLTANVAAHCRERGYGIRCNAILPGSFETPMVDQLRASSNRFVGGVARSLPPPHLLANAVVFLASDESRLVNGAELVVDGGGSISFV